MEKRSDNLEKSGSKIGQVNRQLRRSYDANFKMMVINEAESSNNCKTAVKCSVTEVNVRRWRAQKGHLKKCSQSEKSFPWSSERPLPRTREEGVCVRGRETKGRDAHQQSCHLAQGR